MIQHTKQYKLVHQTLSIHFAKGSWPSPHFSWIQRNTSMHEATWQSQYSKRIGGRGHLGAWQPIQQNFLATSDSK